MLRNHRNCILIVIVSVILLIGCSGDTVTSPPESGISPDTAPVALEPTWPDSLPVDVAQPWEMLDGEGKVVFSINADTEFIPGIEDYDRSPGTVEAGEALHLSSGDSGSGALCWAQYRMPLGGAEPGVVAVDANLLRMSDDAPSSYYVGLARYSDDSWEWHGPFADSHVRISTGAAVRGGASYLSSLGNLFITVAAHDGAALNVVGVGAVRYDATDLIAPGAPVLSAATPVAGGLMLELLHPGTADLAGYLVYHAPTFFADSTLSGVNAVDYIEGNMRHLLTGIDSLTYVRVAAVDFSGNESGLSNILSAAPLAGGPPELALTTDVVGGLIGISMDLTASGADTYDWDLDGDGVYDMMGDAAGTQSITPASTGIIRPAVRGTAGGGDRVAFAAVSLVIGSNARPIAQGFADPAMGTAPLAVTFTSLSSDFDGTIVRWAWDFDGDKTYDFMTEDVADKDPPPYIYTTPGVYNAKFRAWDDDGAWDVDTVAVLIEPGPANQPPVAAITATPLDCHVGQHPVFSAAGSVDPDGTITQYEWDVNNDGIFDLNTGTNHLMQLTCTVAGRFNITVRVTDNEGATDTAAYLLTVHGWVTVTVDSIDDVGKYSSLAVVDGNPAISYHDETNGNLKYARATTSTGSDAADWTQIVVVDSIGDVGEYTSLAVVDSCPAISYHYVTSGDLKYGRATTSTGGDAADWTQLVTVDSADFVGTYTSLALVAGSPAISYHDATNADLKYARATTSSGSEAADWTQIVTVDSTGMVGLYSSLAVVDGCPAISYRDTSNTNLKYARSATNTGGAILAWTQIITVDDTADVGGFSSLAVVGGCPAISYYDTTNTNLKYARADNSTGSTVADWPQKVTVDSFGSVGMFTSLAVIDGRPAIGFFDNTNNCTKLAQAGSTGSTSGDWTHVVTADSTANNGYYISLAQVDGCPAISYYNFSDDDLMYAICF